MFLFLTGGKIVFSQNKIIDSLQLALKNAKHDTVKLKLRSLIGEAASIFRVGYWDSISIDAKKLKIENTEAAAISNIGFIYYNQGNISQALEYLNKGLIIQEEIGDKQGIANSLNSIGSIYNNQGDISRALNCYEKNLKMQEEIGDKNGISNTLNNIGFIYQNQGDNIKALDFYNKSVKLHEQLGDKDGAATTLNNIGTLYYNDRNIEKALDYYARSLTLREKIKDQAGIATSLNNFGVLYKRQGDIAKALDYYLRSLKIRHQTKDKDGIAESLNNIGGVYVAKKNYALALSYCDSSLMLSKELGYPQSIRNAEEVLAIIHTVQGNFTKAFEHYKQFIIYRDSINNEGTRKASIRSQLKYDYDKKEAVINEQQEKERALAQEKSHFQQIVIWSVIVGLLLVIIFAIFVFRSLKTTREQKTIIEQKQLEILDSIRYANRIQAALLPNEKYIEKSLTKLQSENK